MSQSGLGGGCRGVGRLVVDVSLQQQRQQAWQQVRQQEGGGNMGGGSNRPQQQQARQQEARLQGRGVEGGSSPTRWQSWGWGRH